MYTIKMPPRFVEDCLECDCDVGSYANGKLTATAEQLAEIRSRAEYYTAEHGPDASWIGGLKASARATLRALERAGH